MGCCFMWCMKKQCFCKIVASFGWNLELNLLIIKKYHIKSIYINFFADIF